ENIAEAVVVEPGLVVQILTPGFCSRQLGDALAQLLDKVWADFRGHGREPPFELVRRHPDGRPRDGRNSSERSECTSGLEAHGEWSGRVTRCTAHKRKGPDSATYVPDIAATRSGLSTGTPQYPG